MIFGWFHALVESRTGHLRARFVFWCAAPSFLIGAYFCSAEVRPFSIFFSSRLCSCSRRWISSPRKDACLSFCDGQRSSLRSPFLEYAIYASWQEGRGWRAAALEMGRAFLEKSKQGQDDLFLIAENEKLASVLGYHLRDALVAPAGHPPSTSENRRMSPINLPFGPPTRISWRPIGLLMNILPNSMPRIPSWAAALSISLTNGMPSSHNRSEAPSIRWSSSANCREPKPMLDHFTFTSALFTRPYLCEHSGPFCRRPSLQ